MVYGAHTFNVDNVIGITKLQTFIGRDNDGFIIYYSGITRMVKFLEA